jgi:hypothetical protein
VGGFECYIAADEEGAAGGAATAEVYKVGCYCLNPVCSRIDRAWLQRLKLNELNDIS